MPITQARMQDIIREAQALRDFARDLSLALSEVIAKRGQPYGVSLAEIAVIVRQSELPVTPALAREQNHFARQAKRNERNALSMAAKRGAADVAGGSINEEGERNGQG
jgi:hypothetical protein